MVSGPGKRQHFDAKATSLGVNAVFVATKPFGSCIADSGSFFSLLPLSFEPLCRSTSVIVESPPEPLYAANGSLIKQLGKCELEFSIRPFVKPFRWTFIVADVTTPLLGKEFLGHHDLLVDCKNNALLLDPRVKEPYIVNNITVDSTAATFTNQLLSSYHDVFGEITPQDKVLHPVEHLIVTKGPPQYCRPRKLFGEKLRIARAYFAKLMEQGIVYRGWSPWASPLHMAPKKDPQDPFRPCGDYRSLNKDTLPDQYPMPNVNDLTNDLAGCKVFSKLDLVNAFHQIPMAREDQMKTAITTPFGMFIYKRMPFGLRNASQTFQRLIDTALQGLPFAKAYIDDILVSSRDVLEHRNHLKQVFDRMRQFNLRLKPRKCKFFQKEVEFVGIEISQHGFRPLKEKVAAINLLEPPSTVRGVKRFLGMCGFYHRFVKNFSAIASPLYAVTQGTKKNSNVAVNWTPELTESFNALKAGLKSCVTLAFPDPSASIELVTDASEVAAGAVLHQVVDGKRSPLAFYSRKFHPNESKKSAFDRELLAIYLSLKNFNWLLGLPFKILTDHKPLVNALSMKSPTPQQSRWLSYISEFSCTIEHVAGEDNIVADSLSRPSCTITTTGFDARLLAQQQKDDTTLQEHFRRTNLPLVSRTVDSHEIICDRFFRPYIPTSLRFPLFRDYHCLSHSGPDATLRTMQEHYVWPGMRKTVKLWAKQCEECQRSKITRHTKSLIGDIPSTARFHTIHIDLVGPLPPSNGFRYLVTMIDRFTNWVEVVPVADMHTETVAFAFINGWISRFGVPRFLISDRGTQFESSLWSAVMKQMGIKRNRTTAFHPACNGAIERFHRTLKNSIRAKCDHPSWYRSLPLILLGIRTTINKHGYSPANMVYGSNLDLPINFFVPFQPDVRQPSTEFMNQLFHSIRDFPAPVRNHSAMHYIPKNMDKVTKAFILDPSPASSLEPRYTGPYEILERDDKTMTLKLRPDRIERISIDRIKPAFMFTETVEGENEPPTTTAYNRTGNQHTQTAFDPLQEDTVVLAKFGGYPPWPALVINHANSPMAKHRKSPTQAAVQFFSTGKYAFVDKQQIQPFRIVDTKHRGVLKATKLALAYIESLKPKQSKHHAKSVTISPATCITHIYT